MKLRLLAALLVLFCACVSVSLLAQAPAAATATPPAPAATTPELVALGEFDIAGQAVGYVPTTRFLKFVHDAEAGVKQVGMFEGRGPLAILLLVFVGGLALNLTPCVLPMIPINLAIIGAGAQASSRARGFALGGIYGAAMALVYGVLGLVVILTAGTFGALNSSAWFNLTIAAVFVVLALAMFDVVSIDFSRFTPAAGQGRSRGSFALAFGMGAIAALLAGACVAPVVLQVILLSSSLYTSGKTIALGLPFLLGIGMAAPWPLAGAGIAALPKPGAWMVRVKQGFGVVILALAAYYGYIGYGIVRAAPPATAAVNADGSYASLVDGLAAAKRAGKPVFIDMWATWCKNCTVMDETTFKDPDVVKAMSGYVKVRFQAEDPEAEPAKSLMARFDTVGLPTYVILRSR